MPRQHIFYNLIFLIYYLYFISALFQLMKTVFFKKYKLINNNLKSKYKNELPFG